MTLTDNKKGLTFVEVMFSTIIGLMILGMVMVIYVAANNSMIVGLSLAEINADGRVAMDRIVRDLRKTTDIETTRTIDSTVYVTGDDELIIEVPAVDSSRNVIASTFDYIVYTLDDTISTRLRMIVDADVSSSRTDTDQVIAENINTFSLTSGGTGLSSVASLSTLTAIEIAITVSKQALQGKTVTQTLNSDVELRNN